MTLQEITSKLTEQYKDVQVGIEFITPQQAQIYMNRNFANNRKTVLNSIKELEREMKAGGFTLSNSAFFQSIYFYFSVIVKSFFH